jgi:hypothetical protein
MRLTKEQRAARESLVAATVIELNLDIELQIKEILERQWPGEEYAVFAYESEDNAGWWWFCGFVKEPDSEPDDTHLRDSQAHDEAAERVNDLLGDIYDVHDDPWIAAGMRWARIARRIQALGTRW